MIVDTSALIAILRDEPECARLSQAIEEASVVRISTATWLETAIVVDSLRDPIASRALDDLASIIELEFVPVTVEQTIIARAAYRDFGRGSGHKANLNFGDCFAYALSKHFREPLLFKGCDFSETDVMVA